MKRVAGKYAVISGGNSGIGAATARLFAEEGAAGIAILDLRKPDADFDALANELSSAWDIDAVAIYCDVSQTEMVKAAFAEIINRFGRIDIDVNCAGVLDFNSSVLRTTDELWETTIGTNQNGVFYCCREALRQMEKQGEGAIVNVSSVAGISGNSGAAYSCSKHAVIGLSKNIAIQYSGRNIRCNSICPGPTITAMTERKEAELNEAGLPRDERFDHEFALICQHHSDISVGPLEAIDQARAILFFASDEARGITGQWMQVDKGFY